MKKQAFTMMAVVMILIAAVSFGDEGYVPNCKPGFDVMSGGKTINFTNNTEVKETLVVNLVSASWDEGQQRWANGKTYSLALPADPGATVKGLLSYQGCGKDRHYAAAIQISITGAPEYLYQMTDDEPYAPGEQGNSNSIINVVSDQYDVYQASFAN